MTQKKQKQKQNTSKRNRKFWVIYLIFLLLCQEFLFRVCFPLPEISNFNRINYQVVGPTQGKPAFIRNIRMIWKSYPDTVNDFYYDLNGYGFRDKNWTVSQPESKKRIMFIGDSFVEGMMADAKYTIPSEFQQLADADNNYIEVMNLGMMGIGLNEYIKLIVDAVPVFKPDFVFLVMFSNDVPFQRTYTPSPQLVPVLYSKFKPRLLELYDQYKLNDPIPFRWHFSGKSYYPAVPSPNNPLTYYEDEFRKNVTPPIADAMKKGNFNFFRKNWILEEEKFLKAPADLKSQLMALKAYIEKYNSRLMVFYIPSRNQVSTYYYQYEKQYCLVNCPDAMDLTADAYQIHRKMLAALCSELSLPFFDLTDPVISEERKDNHLYWNYDDHMRGKGYIFTGKMMYEWWRKQEIQ